MGLKPRVQNQLQNQQENPINADVIIRIHPVIPQTETKQINWEVILQGYGEFIYTLISSNLSALARLVPDTVIRTLGVTLLSELGYVLIDESLN